MFASRTAWDLRPNRLTEAINAARSSRREFLDLTISNPTECGFAFLDDTILQSLSTPESLSYQPEAQGLLKARESVASYYAKKEVAVDVKNIFLTTSTSEGYSFIFRLLCEPGDEVLVAQPSYPLFELLAQIQDVRLVAYPLIYDHGWQIDLHHLEDKITPRTRAIIVVNPNNPTGSFVKAAELSKLNDLCQKHELALIADEVFHDYQLHLAERTSFAANNDALSFTLSGLSKVAGLPQMKVAWIVVSGPERRRRESIARLDMIADTYLSVNAPLQNATPALLDTRIQFQEQLRSRLHANLKTLDKMLSGQKHCSRLEVEGGWYVTLRVPITQSDEELAVFLLENEGVLVQPGHFFDFHQEGYLILSLMTPEGVFAQGMSRILKAVSLRSSLIILGFHCLSVINGFVSRSSPIVVAGPWPGTTITSSGRDMSVPCNEAMILSIEPPGRSVLPILPANKVSPAISFFSAGK
jgi:alanine-synthesizing transaminase